MTYEIKCSKCSQIIQADRGSCPYCGTPIKSYWYYEFGELKQAVIIDENDERFVIIKDKKLPISSWDVPDSVKRLFKYTSRKPNTNFFVKVFERIFLGRPALWDHWID